jgi:anti-sigma regulatory factor (Ser/Thr protein kinase)
MEAGRSPRDSAEFRLVLSPDARAGWRARQALRDRFSKSLPPATLIDLVAIVTELVNNAVRHGPSRPIMLALVLDDEVIRGEVADQGNPAFAIPEIVKPAQRAAHGLEVVDKLTSRWAVIEGSTHVWFELPLDSR